MISGNSSKHKVEHDSSMMIGLGKASRRAYGFDEIALVPGDYTLDPELCDISYQLGPHKFETPIIASGMDSVVDVKVAATLGKLGSLGVLNLQGIQTRYENLDEIYEKISKCDKDSFVEVMQELYKAPVKDALIQKRIEDIKKSGAITAVSITPNFAEKYGPVAVAAGCDIIFVQSTVTGIEHRSALGTPSLNLAKFVSELGAPVVVGNCVTYKTALELLETGVAGILVGIGPGAACTSRSVLGIGVPMATAIADCAAARATFIQRKGLNPEQMPAQIPTMIADGGMVTGGDICKALACGADAVMIGSPFARATESPGHGFHWGMATPSPVLPRGTRIKVGTTVSLERILHGPALTDDGTQNLTGAIKTSMATLGASNLSEMKEVEVIIAPSILTEGKVYQTAQQLGMGRK
ncbi:MAG: GuaB3 family IMP dehydrogenase-related protein [Candidatus Melainabacteria bacterium]|nr:GuaB3 family IMP dehydrogenase-related protein [Candidatus Melainabacteria bacterium]